MSAIYEGTGLTDQEAAARRGRGQGNNVEVKTGRTYSQIFRENLLTFFNIVLFFLAGLLLLLGSPRDAFFTGFVAFLNVVVATVQEIRAKHKLDQIALMARPKITLLRNGQEVADDPSEIVLGDVVLAGAGDQIVVDGTVVGLGRGDLDESLLTGESDLVPHGPGDDVLSGSHVVTGRIAYEATRVGNESFINKLTEGARAFSRELTPLQRQVNLVIRILLIVVLFFGILIGLNYFLTAERNEAALLASVQAASVVFGLAPSSLFLMIVVTYALGAVRIADKGALVQQSNAVESLSHVSVLCLDKTGTLTANQLALREVLPLTSAETETQLRHWLGCFGNSAIASNKTNAAIVADCEGKRLPVGNEAPFSSARKWSGLTFDHETMRGTFVLGAPEVLAGQVANGETLVQRSAEMMHHGLRVLLFAYRPDPVVMKTGDAEPVLPDGLTGLCLLTFSDELRPEARETLAQFEQAGITIKIISGDSPDTVAALAKEAGLGSDEEPLTAISGAELAEMDEQAFAASAESHTIFGRITPDQKRRLVQALRDAGHYVAMTGDGVNDVLALKQAKLGIAMESGTQATRNVADIVLLNDDFAALPEAFLEGQRIQSGMGDILRLYMVRILSLGLIIATLAMLSAGFPYTPSQNSVVSLISLSIPAFALALLAKPGAIAHGNLIRHLVNFVLPATLMTAAAAITVYLIFVVQTGDVAYSQMALTYASIAMGLVLVIFVEPPSEFWVGGDSLSGDWKPTLVALGMVVVLLFSPWIPILSGFFGLEVLASATDYVMIGAIVLVWLVVLRFTWRWQLFDRYLDVNLQVEVEHKEQMT